MDFPRIISWDTHGGALAYLDMWLKGSSVDYGEMRLVALKDTTLILRLVDCKELETGICLHYLTGRQITRQMCLIWQITRTRPHVILCRCASTLTLAHFPLYFCVGVLMWFQTFLAFSQRHMPFVLYKWTQLSPYFTLFSNIKCSLYNNTASHTQMCFGGNLKLLNTLS